MLDIADEQTIQIIVPGQPIAKGRPRSFIRSIAGKATIGVFTPQTTARWEAEAKKLARIAMLQESRQLIRDPVSVFISAYFEIPASWPDWKRAAAAGERGDWLIAPTGRPDIDNVQKAVLDALNGTVIEDDAQIVSLACSARYSETPEVVIQVNRTSPKMLRHDVKRLPDNA